MYESLACIINMESLHSEPDTLVIFFRFHLAITNRPVYSNFVYDNEWHYRKRRSRHRITLSPSKHTIKMQTAIIMQIR
jgi:hypothetical protein